MAPRLQSFNSLRGQIPDGTGNYIIDEYDGDLPSSSSTSIEPLDNDPVRPYPPSQNTGSGFPSSPVSGVNGATPLPAAWSTPGYENPYQTGQFMCSGQLLGQLDVSQSGAGPSRQEAS